MNLFLAYTDSLKVLRHARRSDDLMLVPANHLSLKDDTSVDVGLLGDMLPQGLVVPTRGHPLSLRFPGDAARSQSALVSSSPNLATLPTGSYLEVLSADGDPSPFSRDHGGHVLVESAPLSLVSAAQSLYRSVAQGRITERAALIRLSAFAMELCGSYARDPARPGTGDILYDLDPLAGVEDLRRALRGMPRLHGAKLARRAAGLANDGSGSAMETLWYFAFCLPPRLGGIHLERPLQNVALEWPEGTRELACHDRLRPDFHWPRYGRVGEYDSELHKNPSAFYEDRNRAKDYALCHLGYFPITDKDTADGPAMLAFLRQFVKSLEDVETAAFFRRMRRILNDPEVDAARVVLHSLLMPPVVRYEQEIGPKVGAVSGTAGSEHA